MLKTKDKKIKIKAPACFSLLAIVEAQPTTHNPQPITHNLSTENMKKRLINLTLVMSFVMLILSSCMMVCEEGSGNIVKDTRNLRDFSEIALRGSGKVFIKQGNTQSLMLEADDNIIDLIETFVKGERLIITNRNTCIRHATLNFYLTVKELTGIYLSGSGDIKGENTLTAENFTISVTGSGNINLDLDTESLVSRISGSGTMYLSGESTYNIIRIGGSGDIRAFDLKTRDTEVTISGSGNAMVNAYDDLDVKINGSGDVRYTGRPEEINKSIHGSGSLRRK